MILYELLTGSEMFKHVKNKKQLKDELDKFKKGCKVEYPKELHPNWTILTQKMLVFDPKQRPSFSELKSYWNSVYDKMETEINAKYGFDDENQVDINTSAIRSKKINPYQSIGQKNVDPEKKLKE